MAKRVVYSTRRVGELNNEVYISVLEHQLLPADFGKHIGGQVNDFILQNKLDNRMHLIASPVNSVFFYLGSQ